MNASVVIAALNEAQTVADVVKAARHAAGVREVVVVSDGSRDATGTVARQAGASVIELSCNVGKAGAVMVGVERACGEIIVLLDADLIGLQPETVESLLRPLVSGDADMTVGVFNQDLMQTMLPSLSGQRAIKRALLLSHPDLRDRGFGLERALAAIARRERWRVRTVKLAGVSHRLKEQKYGLLKGYRAKLRVAEDIIVRNGRRRRPITRRTSATTLVVLLMIYGVSGLFIKQTAASYFETMPAPTASDRVLLVAAHNDDEIIAAGGYLAAATEAGSDVTVVILTNGDGNKFSAAVLGRHIRPRRDDFIREGRTRQGESVAALGRLGIPRDHMVFMGFPDRGLSQLLVRHWSKTLPYTSPFTRVSAPPYPGVHRSTSRYTGEDLLENLAAVLEAVQPTVILVHSPLDEHPDHKAAHAFLTLALEHASGRPFTASARRYGFVIHARDFPRPLRYAPNVGLAPPAHLRGQERWATFVLSPAQVELKRHALHAYRSQYKSPYLRLLLSSFIRRNELFIEESTPDAQ